MIMYATIYFIQHGTGSCIGYYTVAVEFVDRERELWMLILVEDIGKGQLHSLHCGGCRFNLRHFVALNEQREG